MIKRIDNKNEREKICMEILEALPEWFEIPESRLSYAKESRKLPFFADIENDNVRGFIAMKETSHYTVEICVMGVKKEYHRMGIGSKLFEAFYQKMGFRELECMDGLWDEANPCQVYVMAVR